MNHVSIFIPLLFIIFFVTMIMISIVLAQEEENEVTLQASNPSTTSGGSLSGLIGCIKDSSDTNAYCGSLASYAIKLTLNPIAFSAQVAGTGGVTGVQVALYTGGGSGDQVFYNDDGTAIKYVPAASFSSPTTVTTTGYTFNYRSRMAVDNANHIIFLSDYSDVDGGSLIIKITGLDTSSPTATSSITLSGSGDKKPADLLLATTGDLYVALAIGDSTRGRVARITNPSSPSPTYTKTVTFSQSNAILTPYPCLHEIEQNGNKFLFVVTHKRGVIVKLSIGSSDEDFDEVNISSAPEVSSSSWWSYTHIVTPDASTCLILSSGISKVFFFDMEAFTYQSKSFDAVPQYVMGGVMVVNSSNNNNKHQVALAESGTNTVYHFEFVNVSDTSSSCTRIEFDWIAFTSLFLSLFVSLLLLF